MRLRIQTPPINKNTNINTLTFVYKKKLLSVHQNTHRLKK